METTLKTIESPIDPAVMADLEAVCNAGGIVRDLELYRRVSGRADVVRREMLAKFGVQDVAAEIVREMRDGR